MESETEVHPLVGEWTFVSLNDERLIGSVAHHFGSRDLAIKSIEDLPTTIEDFVIRFNADLTYTDSYGAFGTWSATRTVATLSEGYDVFQDALRYCGLGLGAHSRKGRNAGILVWWCRRR